MSDPHRERDLARKPLPFVIGWGIPILILLSVNFLEDFLPSAPIIWMMGGTFIWMGAGCVINALRCGRLHCYISGPAMLTGGTLILLVGFNILDLGPVRVMHLSYTTLTVVVLSFIPELFAGTYGQKYRNIGKE